MGRFPSRLRRRPDRRLEALRAAVQVLPERTRRAMLAGIAEEKIIVGAYASKGGTCPLLAAHRRGGRTTAPSFACAWDRWAGNYSPARPATADELDVLRRLLVETFNPPERPARRVAWPWAVFRSYDEYLPAATLNGGEVADFEPDTRVTAV